MSDEDIAAGSRWLPEIAGELGEARVGLLCVTPENQFNPWLVFEAGALSKTLDQTFVCPLLFDLTPGQLSGPLAQFQSTLLDRAGVLRVLQNLNTALGTARLSDSDLQETFEVWWPRLEERIAATPTVDAPAVRQRAPNEMLEEILSLVREQLRRENLRLEHSQARDERLDQVLPMFEQLASAAKQMQEKTRSIAGALEKLPLPPEFKQLFPVDAPTHKLDEMLGIMQDQSRMSRLELQQLLNPPEAGQDAGGKT